MINFIVNIKKRDLTGMADEPAPNLAGLCPLLEESCNLYLALWIPLQLVRPPLFVPVQLRLHVRWAPPVQIEELSTRPPAHPPQPQ